MRKTHQGQPDRPGKKPFFFHALPRRVQKKNRLLQVITFFKFFL